MIRSYFSQQLRGRNNGCPHVSDSTFCSPILHLAGAALTRQMLPKSATLLFLFPAALWVIVTTAWFAFFFIPALLSKCKIYICVCAKVNWFRTASEKQFVSNYRKSLASVKVHSITPFLWFPQFHFTGPDPICQGSNALSVFILFLVSSKKKLLAKVFDFSHRYYVHVCTHDNIILIISFGCKVLLEIFRSWQLRGCWFLVQCPNNDGFWAVHTHLWQRHRTQAG